jgi:hypothetical protein
MERCPPETERQARNWFAAFYMPCSLFPFGFALWGVLWLNKKPAVDWQLRAF